MGDWAFIDGLGQLERRLTSGSRINWRFRETKACGQKSGGNSGPFVFAHNNKDSMEIERDFDFNSKLP